MFQATTLGTHDAPGHTGGKTQLLAFHHIEGAVKRNDDRARGREHHRTGLRGVLHDTPQPPLPLPWYVHSHRNRRYRVRTRRKCRVLRCRGKYRRRQDRRHGGPAQKQNSAFAARSKTASTKALVACGGNVCESNTSKTFCTPRNGFEDRGAHRSPSVPKCGGILPN